MHRIVLGGLFISFFLLSWGLTAVAQDLTVEHWQGEYPVAELHRFLEDQEIRGVGYIADQETWESVWSGFESNPVPVVDFPNEFVVYVRNVDFVNIISPLSVSLDERGVADVVAATTLTARPIEDFVYWSAASMPADEVRQLASAGQFLAVQVPEPTGIWLAGVGAVVVVALKRKRHN